MMKSSFHISTEVCQQSISWSDFLQAGRDHIDPADPYTLLRMVPYLRQLHNNRTFLLDFARQQFQGGREHGKFDGHAPAFMLANEDSFIVRAVIWDENSEDHSWLHNHNFDFLTLGYFGDGYVQEVFQFDGNQELFADKAIAIEALGPDRLAPGEIRFFDSRTIMHSFPRKSSFSITINVIHKNLNVNPQQQYLFDFQRQKVVEVLNPHFDRILIEMLSALAQDQDRAYLERLARDVGRPFSRIAAIEGLARLDPRTLQDFAQDRSEFVRLEVKRLRAFGEHP